jgi:hypothetical protein
MAVFSMVVVMIMMIVIFVVVVVMTMRVMVVMMFVVMMIRFFSKHTRATPYKLVGMLDTIPQAVTSVVSKVFLISWQRQVNFRAVA